jgi:hypothetical protein
MSNDTAKTQTINIVPVQGIFEPLPPYKPVTLIGPAGTPFFAPTNPNLDGVSITNSTINSSVIGGITPAAGTFTNIATTTGTITSVPSGPTSIVNQAYVDAVAQGLSFKQPAAFTTSGDITLSGLSTQAGGDWPSTLTAGDRILVRNQTAQEDNGIYVAASGAWTRAADANTYDEFLSAYLFVISGTVYSGSAWVCTNQPGGTLGVTPIVFIQFSNTALYNAGTGLTLTGFTFSITNTGVTAASYGSASDTLTAVVNAQGQLTSLAASPIAILNTQVSGLGTMSTQNANTVAITGGNIDGTTIGGTTPAAVTGTTVTANTQFSGAGTGLTGTASALSIGGNAATATSATTATNLAGGATGSLPYQSGAGATTFLAAGTNGHVLTLAGGVPTWAAEQFQGDVVGPASATDNAIARFDTTSGKLIQNSAITLSDAGALQNVNEINFDTTPTGVVGGAGSLAWNNDDNAKTLDLVMEGGAIVQQIGEETFYRVRASSAITAGQSVMFTGTLGASGGLTAAPATGLTAATGQYLMGIAAESISLNSWGYVTHFGEVRGIDTSGTSAGEVWVNGDILYYNPSVTGGLTKSVPAAPNAKVEVCAVVYANASNGIVFVRPTFYPSFNQLNDVSVPTPSGGDLVVYNSANTRWQNAAQSTITAGKATNLAGGSAGQVPYQSAADTTGFTATGTTGQVLTSQGTSAPTWTTPVAAVTVTDDTTTNNTRYPLFADATSGTLATTFVSSTKYQFNPSSGDLSATSFSGAGTGLTGTASGLSIGGNAATATSATTATNVAGGAANQLVVQSGANATTFVTAPTSGSTFLEWSGSAFQWSAAAGGVTITDDTTTNATRYVTFTDATTGTEPGLDVSSTKLQFNPSSGALTVSGQLSADNITIDGNTISSTNTDGNIELDPNGTGAINIVGPVTAGGTAAYLLKGITYLTSGTAATYTTPTGVRALYVEVVGGGGGGGGSDGQGSGTGGAAGGGGGGGYVSKLIASPSASYTYTIGAGGNGGASGNNGGTNGSNTTFTDGTLTLTGNGGVGGSGINAAATLTFFATSPGGSGSGGDIVVSGYLGGPRNRGDFSAMIGGFGGGSVLGNAPRGESATTGAVAGTAATQYGAGGSGAASCQSSSNAAGGNGYQGVIRITEYY